MLKGVIDMLLTKPQLHPLAGWKYLFDKKYRQDTQQEWQNMPSWIVAMQIITGCCSLLFPLIVISLLAFVLISRII